MAHLLIVDDEQSICWGLSKLGRTMGHTVAAAASAEEAFVLARRQRPDAVVLDIRLPGMDGLSALREFRAEFGDLPIVIITAFGDLATAVQAVRGGAFEYLVKPFDLHVAERTIQRAAEAAARPFAAQDPSVRQSGEEIVGVSAPMQEVFKRIALVAPSDACVHLHGESGTGKELVARAIHRYSRRADGPLVAINIASLSPSVAESELFGHARGAFTGADEPHQGLLERADGGTIFLDEVADIPLSLQVKILRALEHGEVLPVGGDRPVPTDFRVISATHQDLRRQVAAGTFRHDLYFRLITFEVEIPPLRARREDIGPLTSHFLNVLATRGGHAVPSVSDEAMAELERRPWHGNVRELRNAIEHALILVRGNSIAADHLPPPMPPPNTHGAPAQAHAAAPLEDQIAALIRQWGQSQMDLDTPEGDLYERLLRLVEPPLLQVVMEQCRGQCALAARLLGLHRTTLRKKLDELGLEQLLARQPVE
ncbi:MAG: sigma-54-dependent transcriptional regulator [Planctomycetota bacterium]